MKKNMMNAKFRILMIPLLFILLLLSSCQDERSLPETVDSVPGGNVQLGAQYITQYGCNTCHLIPGIRNAEALIGPPLIYWADRHYIAGELLNTPDNTMRFIINPQEYQPGTAMPNMDVTLDHARDITAYLYTLQR
jgi:cytochrome c